VIEGVDLRLFGAEVSDLRGLPGPDFEVEDWPEGRGGLKGLGGILGEICEVWCYYEELSEVGVWRETRRLGRRDSRGRARDCRININFE